MIHKQVPNPDKSSLKHVRIGGLLGYISNPDDGAKCIFFGLSPAFICDDVAGAILEMTANAEGAVRSRDTIHHVVLSWPGDEYPTLEQAAEAARIYIEHIGCEGHLYAYALHADTENGHLHIVLDRATAEGKMRKINRGFTQIAGAEAIALIEAVQGWRPAKHAMVSVLEDGTLARSSSQREASDLAPSPPQRVVDQAAHRGDKTQIEIVQEKIGDLFRSIGSWSDLHAVLSDHDLRYERKGSGAIIWINDEEAVKASSVSRHASLRKLEKRLGPFLAKNAPKPKHSGAPPPPSAAEASERVAMNDLAQAFEHYHAAVQADRYRVTSLRVDPVTKKKLVMILDKQAGETIGFTPDELRARLPEIARLDARGENLYLWPLSSHYHHLTVDDVNAEGLAALKAQGVTPAVVLESSPKNFQVIVNVPRVASDDLDRQAANALVRELNQDLCAPKLSGAIHPHRMPGSCSQKVKHRSTGKLPIVRLVEAAGGVCLVAADRLRAAYDSLVSAAEAHQDHRKIKAEPVDLPKLIPNVMPEATASEVYEAHRKDVTRLLRTADDLRRLDEMIAVRLAATRLSQAEVASAIEAGVLAAKYPDEKRDWASEYAARTAANAFLEDIMAWRERSFGKYFEDWQAITDAARMAGSTDIEDIAGPPDV